MLKQNYLPCLINDNMSCEKLSGLERFAKQCGWWRESHFSRWIDYVIEKIEKDGITDDEKVDS